ncbi:MAG: DUF167 domain-containing protein [Dehalococcoidia bacterium]
MRLTVRVTPRANRDVVVGFAEDGTLLVRVSAAPANGEANASVVKLLAKALGLPSREIVMTSGATSRVKIFELPLELGELENRLKGPLR